MNYYIPKKITLDILAELGLQPMLQVPIKPIESGKKLYCLNNVNTYLAQNPGSIQYGWIFSMFGSVIIKLHGHAVIQNENGALLCVTPPEAKLDYHNFVPDNSIADLISNQRLPTKAVSLVKNKVVNKMVELENKSDLARLNSDRFELERALQEKLEIKAEFERTIKKITGRNDICYCGSGKKHKDCCLQ